MTAQYLQCTVAEDTHAARHVGRYHDSALSPPMFRALFRRPRSVNVPHEGGRLEVQKVEISRKTHGSTVAANRLVRSVVQVILFYSVYRTISLLVNGPDPDLQKRINEIRKENEAAKNQPKPSEAWKKQHAIFAQTKPVGKAEDGQEEKRAAPSDVITIPIPGWIKELEKKQYKTNDPEVKAYDAFRQDAKAVGKLNKTFDEAIVKNLQSNGQHLSALQFVRFTGQVQRDVNLAMMVSRPPTYAVRCIHIRSDSISLGWKELEATQGTRAQKLLHPWITGKAFLSGVKAFSTTSVAIAHAKIQDLMAAERKVMVELKYFDVKRYRMLGSVRILSDSHEDKVISQLPTAHLNEVQAKKRFPFLRGDLDDGSPRETFRSHVKSVTHQFALQHSVNMFREEWAKGQLASQQLTTPGAVSVVGFYDFVGERGRYRVEVFGRYLPSEEAFIGPPRILRGVVLHSRIDQKAGVDGAQGRNRSVLTPASTAGQQQQQQQAHDGQIKKPDNSNNPEAGNKSPPPEKEVEK